MNGFANFVNHSSKRTERERRLGRGTRGEMAKKEEAKTRGESSVWFAGESTVKMGPGVHDHLPFDGLHASGPSFLGKLPRANPRPILGSATRRWAHASPRLLLCTGQTTPREAAGSSTPEHTGCPSWYLPPAPPSQSSSWTLPDISE